MRAHSKNGANLSARRDSFANTSLGRGTSRKAEPLVLTPGDRKTGVTVKMIPHGAIAGRIVDEDDDTIQGMQVYAMTYQYTTRSRELVETHNVIPTI